MRGSAPVCPSCAAAFRSPLVAALLSAALPGSGHLYLRRRALGIAEMAAGFTLFVTGLVFLARVFLRVVSEGTSPLELLTACLPWVVLLGAFSLLDGLFTWLVSRRRVVLAPPRDGPSKDGPS